MAMPALTAQNENDDDAIVVPTTSPIKAAVPSMSVEAAVEVCRNYRFGQSREALTALAAHVQLSLGDAARKQTIEGQLIGLLETATPDGRNFALRQLLLVGGEKSVPALAQLLTGKASHLARCVLERLALPSADAALRDALGRTTGEARIGIIASLGERRDAAAVEAIAGLLSDDDSATACASANALGRIGTAKAAAALRAAMDKPGADAAKLVDAAMQCAQQLLVDGNPIAAAELSQACYRRVSGPARLAALRCWLASSGEDAASILADALRADPQAQQQAVVLVAEIPASPKATAALAAMIPSLSPAGKIAMVEALAARGDPVAAPAAVTAAGSDDASLRIAGLRALGRLGDATHVDVLLSRASGSAGPEQETASAALGQLRDAKVHAALLEKLSGTDEATQIQIIRLLATRAAPGCTGRLLDLARGSKPAVRLEALRAMATLATAADVPALLKLLDASRSPEEQQAAEKALAVACAPLDAPAAPVLAAMAKAPMPGHRCSLLRVLGALGGPEALTAVRGALQDSDAQIHDTAVRALANWPDLAATEDLAKLMAEGRTATHQVLAIRGYIRLAGSPKLTPQRKLAMYQRAAAAARRPEEQRLAIGGMGSLRTIEALRAVSAYLEVEGVKQEACAAAVAVAEKLSGNEVATIMKKVLAASTSDRVKKSAKTILDRATTKREKR